MDQFVVDVDEKKKILSIWISPLSLVFCIFEGIGSTASPSSFLGLFPPVLAEEEEEEEEEEEDVGLRSFSSSIFFL